MTDSPSPTSLLRFYGLRPELAALAAEHSATLGRVRTVYGIAWEVVTPSRILRANFDVRSRARREEDHRLRPAVGDWVLLSRDESTIERVLPRASLLSRKAAGKGDVAQVIAANVDVLAVVTSLDADLSERRIERYVLMAREGGVRPAVVCSKADACTGAAREEMFARLATVCDGVQVVVTSARSGEGLDELRSLAGDGVTLALAGSSGVGKSSLVNALLREERQDTGVVRESDQQGKHTTTRRELVPLPGGGVLVDTPGMRELEPWFEDETSVEDAFDDVSALAETCRFRDCAHEREPGCAVRGAVESGALGAARLEGFRKLQGARAAAEKRRAPAGAKGKRR